MTGGYERRKHRVLDYIHANPAGDLSLDALADVAATSRFYGHRVFVAMTGETAARAVRRLRLHRASVLLVEGKAPVEQAARAVSYPDFGRFAPAFRDYYGLPSLGLPKARHPAPDYANPNPERSSHASH